MIRETKSLDVGTMNLISASLSPHQKILLRKLRHAFLKVNIEPSMMAALKKEGLQYAEIDGSFYALADSAFKMAYTMGKNSNRPMQDGILNAGEDKAEVVFRILIEALLKKASGISPTCYFSVPAEPFEGEHRVVYHAGIIQEILKDLGYASKAVNEGLAVVYSSLADTQFTGIGISCGCGLLNVCISQRAKPVDSFSINRAGDWIDGNAAKVLAMTASKVMVAKEKGVHLRNPDGRVEKAIAIYYKDLIAYTIQCLKARVEARNIAAVMAKPVDIVFAGGTAMPAGFVPVFKSALAQSRFPLKIREVFLADDPLYAVARGCLIGALADRGHDEDPVE
ncbi:MAG: hypothetical protein HQL19_08005 [Candidatus Omnitrophica bacterium]|nr:hypothetical protein [Candidatus Omnitrophota bacterium]